MIYLVCFALSVLFAYLAQRTKSRRNFYLLSVVSIALPVLLAGFRHYGVGIDTMNYYVKDLYWAGALKADSLWECLKGCFTKGYGDPLFALLMGIVAQTTGSFTAFLVVAQAVIIIGVYIGVYRHRKYINPAFVLSIFYLFFFNSSLNVMRQYMAMAVLFAFLADIPQKKWWRYLVGLCIAFMLHSTAIIGIGPLALYAVLEYKKDRGLSPMKRQLAVSGVMLAGVVLFVPLIRLLTSIHLLSNRFLFFIRDDAVSPAVMIMGGLAIGLAGAFLYRKQIRKNCPFADFYIFNSIVYFVLLQLTFFIAYGKRIGLYFAFADLITLGLVERAPTSRKMRWLVRGGLLAVALIYWVYVYGLRNASQTLPYRWVF